MEYSLQVGTYRQLFGKIGEISPASKSIIINHKLHSCNYESVTIPKAEEHMTVQNNSVPNRVSDLFPAFVCTLDKGVAIT